LGGERIGGVCECLDNKRKPLNVAERSLIKGRVPYYGANGIQGYINDFIFNETLVLLAEDGGNFEEFKEKPIAQIIKGKSWVNNHAHVLKGSKSILIEFLFYSVVHKDIRECINGTSRSKLNKSEMLKIKLDIPMVLEQKKYLIF
jgi:type I restriction enzyme S subunit